MGLRWDVQTSPVESQDLTAAFVANVQSTKVPGAPKGVLFPGDAGVPRGIAANRYHHFSPRFGVAWDPFGDGKTAVRAGAGVFYGSVSGNEWNARDWTTHSIRDTLFWLAVETCLELSAATA